ncbi:MAG TPA: cytochrome c [Vicinamibacteria bacterium]|nr:cytochrome c [Vicinamibacteria bacterium]
MTAAVVGPLGSCSAPSSLIARAGAPAHAISAFSSSRAPRTTPRGPSRPLYHALTIVLAAGLGFACRQDMHDQPRYKPYAKTDFFGDARSARAQVEDTVARGQLRDDARLYAGKEGGQPVAEIPLPITIKLVRRGQERYRIYCTPCHGQLGRGDGMVVQRGYRRPPSFHIDRLRQEKAGYFFDVMTNGFGAMPDYAAQIAPEDRWAIVAYVRVLQLSQNAAVEELPAEARAQLQATPQ